MSVVDPLMAGCVALSVIAALGFAVEFLRLGAKRGTAVVSAAPWLFRAVWPALACVGWAVRPLMSAQWRHSLHARLERAGLEKLLGAHHVLAMQILLGALVSLAAVALIVLEAAVPNWLTVLGSVLAVALPHLWLRDRGRKRVAQLMRGLPFLIDLLAMSVEAGLPLSAAFGQSVERLPPGPLRDECRRVVRDVQAGRGREEALRALAARLDIAGVTQLVMALSAAQRDGSGIVRVLRAQAEQQRNERFLRAEYRAAQAPVRILFPLLVFIFPGTLAVLLFPVASRLVSEFRVL